jgi:hypothetical protein
MTRYTYDDFQMISMRLNRTVNKLDDDVVSKLNKVRRLTGLPVREVIKKTVIVKKDADIGQITKLLNKMTDKTYEKLKTELFVLIENVVEPDDVEKVTRALFGIASTNKFYSILFARLYTELIQVNRDFLTLFQDNFDIYLSEFNNVQAADPNKDYDAFCVYTKQMDQKKSMLMFFINLMKNDICKLDNIADLCKMIVTKLMNGLGQPELKEQNEELINCVMIIMKECVDLLLFHPNMEAIMSTVQAIKTSPVVTPKIKFAAMDIIDLVAKA